MIHDYLTITLQPTGDELEYLRLITEGNLDQVLDYTPDKTLYYNLPFSREEFDIAIQIKQVLAQGGRVLLLTPDSDIPQELTLEQEA